MTEQETPQATPVLPHRPASDEQIADYKRGVMSGVMKSATPNVVASLIARIEQRDPAPPAPFLATDQAGKVLPATITVHASTPLVAVEYVGDSSAAEIVPEHDLVEVARRFRRVRPKAVTTVRPIRTRRIVAEIVLDVPDDSTSDETDAAAGDIAPGSGAVPGLAPDPGKLLSTQSIAMPAAPGGFHDAAEPPGAAIVDRHRDAPEPGGTVGNGPGRRSPVAAIGSAGDRREPAQQPPRAYPGHLAGVGLAERLCREREESLTGRRPIG